MSTNVGWVIYRDKDCTTPRYRIPSQLIKDVEIYNPHPHVYPSWGEEE